MQKIKFLGFTSGFGMLIYRDMYSSANLKYKETRCVEVMNSFHRNKLSPIYFFNHFFQNTTGWYVRLFMFYIQAELFHVMLFE